MPRINEEHLREDLKERLAEAQDQLKRLSAESARLRRFIEGLRDVLGTLNHEGPPAGKLPMEVPKSTLKTGTPIHAMSMKDGARTLLLQHGRMTTRELLDALESAGKRIGGKSARDTLAATLRSYDQIFRRTSDATKWELVSSGVPEKSEENTNE